DATPADWLYQIEWRAAELEQPTPDASPSPSPDPSPLAGSWLVVADASGVADTIVGRLTAGGAQCVVATPGSDFAMRVEADGASPRTDIALDLSDEAQTSRLLDVITANPARPPAGVVVASALSVGQGDNQAAATANDVVAANLEATLAGIATLVQQLARRGVAPPGGLWLLTRGAQAVNAQAVDAHAAEARPASPWQAPVVGFGRVLQTEHPELAPRLVDFDPRAAADADAEALAREIAATQPARGAAADDRTPAGRETEVAYRAGSRFAARLEPAAGLAAAPAALPAAGAYQLRTTKPGTLEALRYEPVERRPPAAGEVEIEVHAAGLNFSDVLKALGLYPGVTDAVVPLGIEASGVVTAVGEGVSRFAVGDAVLGVAPYALGSHATTGEYALAAKPAGVSHQQAATLPITFLTAHHALVRLADLQPGERVLIHAGAGGVGLAAIQIAQAVGAEVFATAGSDAKRDHLRGLGVTHVYNSRTLDFADEARADTGGEGVDVVLNSLPGEAIGRSLSLLRAYGRFLEIGKIDIYQDRRLGLLPFQDNLSYHAIDLDRVLRQRPAYVRTLLDEVAARVAAGVYRPLEFTRFGRTETVDAFRYMSQRRNIGKVVVADAAADIAGHGKDNGGRQRQPRGPVHAGGAYLITGGLGALGLQVAKRFAELGAGAVVLLSRRPPGADAKGAVREIEALGCRVVTLQADVADRRSLDRALATLRVPGLPPLRGVVHAAGVLDDGLITGMRPEQLSRVLAPKLAGAWNLHAVTDGGQRGDQRGEGQGADGQGGEKQDGDGHSGDGHSGDGRLDFFVLFSSVAAVLGSPGQAGYAAANAGLDALAHTRHAAGLAATSINWGPWAGAGMAAATAGDGPAAEGLAERGVRPLPTADALDALIALITAGVPQATVADADWKALAHALGGRRPPLLAGLLPDSGATPAGADTALRRRLASAPPDVQRRELIALVRDELARVMSTDAAAVDTARPMAEFG
ncbi:MAG: SDR family NAD(P)-dependent oxidoreductase, partial [Planctomycetota bacterium]